MKKHIEAVQRMQEYIGTNIYDRISLNDLAKVSLYSSWYSYRLFVRFLNMSPADYIRRLRLSKSALQLRDGKERITDIAFKVGFESVDGYQRAFFREFGCNPREYVASPIPLHLFRPYGIKYGTFNKEITMNDTALIYIQVIEKPSRKVILKRGITATDYFTYCEDVDCCEVWGLLTSIRSISGEPVCLWLPKPYIKEGSSEYVQGVEVATNYEGVIPDGFDMIRLPACKYLMFQGEPFEDETCFQAIEQVWAAIKKYDPAIIGYSWDTNNPRIQLEPIGTRGYIELVAIK